ncbi:MAG: hypothetical protein KGZ96_01395 [Clostridia bacterium]|nr:hypothetical protein [Clostridia bacterium]
MTFSTLTHIILGSVLAITLLLTAYYLMRLVLAPQEKKLAFSSGLRKSAIWTVALFAIYFIWIMIKRAFF